MIENKIEKSLVTIGDAERRQAEAEERRRAILASIAEIEARREQDQPDPDAQPDRCRFFEYQLSARRAELAVAENDALRAAYATHVAMERQRADEEHQRHMAAVAASQSTASWTKVVGIVAVLALIVSIVALFKD